MSDHVPLIAVIGGGMAGLGAAHALETARRAAAAVMVATDAGAATTSPAAAAPDWILFERADYLGGKVRTERVDGFVIEGGPDSFIVEKPWPMELARAVGIYDRLLDSNEDIRKSYVYSGGRLHELPEGLILMVPTRLVPFAVSSLVSWRGKLRMGLDLLLPRGPSGADESLGEFVRRRLGSEALAKIAEPIVAGIHAGDPEQMSVQATFPMFLEMERRYRSLIIGMIRRRRTRARAARAATAAAPATGPAATASGSAGARRPRSYFLSFRTGLADLADAVVADLPADHLHISLGVDALTREPGDATAVCDDDRTTGNDRTAGSGRTVGSGGAPGADGAMGSDGATGDDRSRYRLRLSDGTEKVVDGVVLAGPAFAAAELLQSIDAPAASALASIAYVSTATVSLAYRRADVTRPLHGFGFVVPRAEERRIMAGTFSSLKFPGRAPADGVLVRAFVGRAGREEPAGLPDDELVALVREELASIVGLRAEPVFTRVFRWPRGMPQYRVGHRRLIDGIETRIADLPGIEIAGGYLRGIGIGDCLREGAAAASRAAAHVRGAAG